jgi:hypothetical protein
MTAFCFSESQGTGISLWVGNPDCQAAHDGLLAELANHTTAWLDPSGELNERLKGNLGEFITFFIGKAVHYRECRVQAANALAPLSNIAKPELDLLWLYLPEGEPQTDYAVVQEVKTTGGSDLAYARDLLVDYAKLFGVEPQLTLITRLQYAANLLRYHTLRPDLAERVMALAGISPRTCPAIRLTPTLVHDTESDDPTRVLVSVRTVLVVRDGWSDRSVSTWSVSLSTLSERLERLAKGQS